MATIPGVRLVLAGSVGYTNPFSCEQIASKYFEMLALPPSVSAILEKFTPWWVVATGGYEVKIASQVGRYSGG